MSERAAIEESDERALLYEMWCTLSRVHTDCAFIKVVNLKTIITAILNFPVATSEDPNEPIRKPEPPIEQIRIEEVEELQMSSEEDEEFNLADNFEEQMPVENYPDEARLGHMSPKQAQNRPTPPEAREVAQFSSGVVQEIGEGQDSPYFEEDQPPTNKTSPQ
jgi:hypothetical protein